jgi:alginate O-acetyltransferase complex protein AlgJ
MSRPPLPKILPLSLILALLPALPGCKQTTFKFPSLPKLSFKKKGEPADPAAKPTEDAAKPASAGDKPAAPTSLSPEETAFLEKCATLGKAGGTFAGLDGWNFSSSELQRLAQLKDPNAPSVREATEAILDFRNSLKRKGIELVVVPVPPKAIIFPDKLDKDLKIKSWFRKPGRLDSTLQSIYSNLASKGVKVVDPTSALLASRGDRKAGPVFPRTAAVWSPRGAEITAGLIASNIKGAKWANQPGKDGALITEATTISYTGPLLSGTAAAETLAVRNIGRSSEGKMRSVTFSTGGHPLTLIGDASLLSWREANNPAGSNGTFASLADQLAFELQTTPDLFPGKTDGRNASRLRLLRDISNGRDPLSDSKTLVWVIQATDFALSDWQNVPLTVATRESVPKSNASSIPMFQAPPVTLIPDRSSAPIAPPTTPSPESPAPSSNGEPALPELPR